MLAYPSSILVCSRKVLLYISRCFPSTDRRHLILPPLRPLYPFPSPRSSPHESSFLFPSRTWKESSWSQLTQMKISPFAAGNRSHRQPNFPIFSAFAFLCIHLACILLSHLLSLRLFDANTFRLDVVRITRLDNEGYFRNMIQLPPLWFVVIGGGGSLNRMSLARHSRFGVVMAT